jgi:trehalose/maltose hydrolase-like predicted phosphorylase
MSQIKDEIYDLLSNHIDEQSIIDDIYDKLNDFELEIKESHLIEIKNIKKNVVKLKEEIIQLKDTIVSIEDKYEYEKQQNVLLKHAIKYFSVFRCALNSICHKYWNQYEDKIRDLDYDELCKHHKRKKLDSYGFKYAIARINGNCEGLSVELCHLYLEMNNSFHPKLKPISIVEESVTKIKELLQSQHIPDNYLSIGLTLDIINEFEMIIKTNSHLLN